MSSQFAKPFELKALCLAFLLWSVLSLTANIQRWPGPVSDGTTTSYSYPLDLGVFGFLAAIGLWRLSPAGRTFGLVLTWYWLIGSFLLFFELFPTRNFQVTSQSDFLATVPKGFLRTFVIPFFFVQLWQLHVLRRPDIRALFYPASDQPVA